MKKQVRSRKTIVWLSKVLPVASHSRTVLGDLEELYRVHHAEQGRFFAGFWLGFQLLKSIPGLVWHSLCWGGIMFKNYLKIAMRHMMRKKGFTLINVTGLAVGLVCTLLLLLWVQSELSYDRFHERKDRIFRVLTLTTDDELNDFTPGLLALTAKDEIPEVIRATRILKGSRVVFRHGDRAFYEDGMISVDPDFFDMFSFNFIQGDAKSAIPDCLSLVITREMAEKYFGDDNPVGQVLNWNGWQDYRVSAVLDHILWNSHLKFDFVDSHRLGQEFWANGYTWHNFVHSTYVELHEAADPQLVASKMTELLFRNNPRVRDFAQKLTLQPLRDIHLNGQVNSQLADTFPRKYVTIFTAIAFFILALACVNFMNLSTAKGITRAKEVGLRKVVGSGRWHLISQFLLESVLYTFLATAVAIVTILLSASLFQRFFDVKIVELMKDPLLLPGLFLVLGMTVVASGAYPAFILSSFRPQKVFKAASAGKGKSVIRRVLSVFQFFVSIVLLIGTLVIHQQLSYIRNKDLGFNEKGVISIPLKENMGRRFASVKNALCQNSQIVNVAAKNCFPLKNTWNSYVIWEGADPDNQLSLECSAVDVDYFSTMGMQILHGRPFSSAIVTDSSAAFILNESAIRSMGLKDPLGTPMQTAGREGRIIGVVRDAHFNSLYSPVTPRVYFLPQNLTDAGMNLMGVVLIRVTNASAIEHVKKVWNEFNPGDPFEFDFLDAAVERQYTRVKQMGLLMRLFSGMAFLVSCLGLLGLTTYAAEMRVKEIGIRKVMGASGRSIILLLSREFTIWIVLANILAWPTAWWMSTRWLNEFAYRIDLTLIPFLGAAGCVLAISLPVVLFKAVQSARANPVNSLRFE